MSSSLRAAQASLSAAAARAMSAESAPRPAAAVQRAAAVRPATTVHGAKLVPVSEDWVQVLLYIMGVSPVKL